MSSYNKEKCMLEKKVNKNVFKIKFYPVNGKPNLNLGPLWETTYTCSYLHKSVLVKTFFCIKVT